MELSLNDLSVIVNTLLQEIRGLISTVTLRKPLTIPMDDLCCLLDDLSTLKCRFEGDVRLKNPDIAYTTAMHLYRSMRTQIGMGYTLPNVKLLGVDLEALRDAIYQAEENTRVVYNGRYQKQLQLFLKERMPYLDVIMGRADKEELDG